jgi:hypothetical protein
MEIDEIKQDIQKMIDAKEIGEEDREYALTLLVWIHNGRSEAEKINADDCVQLELSGFAKDEHLLVDQGGLTPIWFSLALGGMQGFIEQSIEDV